jgi:quinoprotein glucose dehydrogenase
MKTPLALLFAAAVCGPALGAGAGDWTSFGRDPGSQRFSPLTQITPDNVARLKVAWTYHMNPARDASAPPSGRAPASETTPLVIDGVMYFSTPYARVVALDADNGKEI